MLSASVCNFSNVDALLVLKAVSYTHLDVSKRQHQLCMLIKHGIICQILKILSILLGILINLLRSQELHHIPGQHQSYPEIHLLFLYPL